MKILKNETDNLDSVVFEKRNKEYGAYAIRAEYNMNKIKSMLITTAVFLSAVGALWFFSGGKKAIDNSFDDIGTVSWLEINNTPEEKKQEEVKKKVTSSAAMKGNVIGTPSNTAPDSETKDNEHQEKTVNGMSTDENANGTSKTDTVVREVVAVEPAPIQKTIETVVYADKMPVYKGDLMQKIQREIVYPETAIYAGTEGVVYVQFLVDEFGNIGSAKVMKGIGDGCDEEALRVVKKLSGWTPGSVNDNPVRVLFNLPIKFKLAR